MAKTELRQLAIAGTSLWLSEEEEWALKLKRGVLRLEFLYNMSSLHLLYYYILLAISF